MVEAPWRFCTYCALVPKVFGFGPFVWSKLLGVFALIVHLCRRFFGSDLLKGRSPLAFFALVVRLCRRFFGSDLLKSRSPLAFFALVVRLF